MKKIIFSLIGILTFSFGHTQGWMSQQSNTTEQLNDVFFIDANHGFAVGNNGTICSTDNGGDLWTVESSGIINHISSVFFTDIDTGFAVTHFQLLKTTNGGVNWVVQDTMTNPGFSQIKFSSPDTGFVIGNGSLMKTVDGGVSWTKHNSAGGFSVQSFWATDSQTLYVGGQDFLTLKSTNGGQSWSPIVEIGSYGNMESIFFTNDSTGYFVGGGFAQGNTLSSFLKTTDGGETWSNPMNNVGTWLMSVFFTDNSTGYISAANGAIFKTINEGNDWSELNSNVTTALNSIYFVDSNIGYTVGNNGVILKTISGGVGIDEVINENSVSIYPNPAFDQITIESSLMFDRIEIIDILGVTVYSTEQKINQLSMQNYASGVYFVKFTSGNHSIKKKIVKQ